MTSPGEGTGDEPARLLAKVLNPFWIGKNQRH
jgi:hypothetical protein